MVWDRVGSGPVEGGEGITIEDEGVEGNWSNGEALVIHDLKIHHLGQYRSELHQNSIHVLLMVRQARYYRLRKCFFFFSNGEFVDISTAKVPSS